MIDWRHWHNEPFLMGGLVLFGWLWAILAGPLRARIAPGEPFPRRQAWFFYSSLVLFYLAVGSPLDQVGERFLFSVHMLQHLILVHPVAILFLLGIPHWMIDLVLRPVGSLKLGRFFFHPFICAFIYALVTSIWHMPYLYNWALQDKTVHVIEHLMFFGAALFFWWTMLSPSRALPRASYPAQMLFFFFMLLLMMPIYAYITFSDNILYPTYEYAPRIFPTFSPADDQLLAGVGMQIVSLSVGMTAFGVAFFRWYAASEGQPAKAK